MTGNRRKPLPGLLYLTYHENVLGAGILHTQVIGMLEQLAGLGQAGKIVLLSYLSPVTFWKERRRISGFKRNLAEKGIRVILLPMIIPAKWNFPWCLAINLWALPTWIVTVLTSSRTIHSRGYPAAMIAQKVAMFTSVRTIFDPRGPYPAEMVMNSIWKADSRTVRFWSKVETRLIRSADSVIGVTPEYRDEFKAREAKRAVFVPNRTTTAVFRNAFEKSKNSIRNNLCPELLFIGELHSVWNDPAIVARHFKGLCSKFPDARLRMITTADPARASDVLKGLGVDMARVSFESRRPSEMPEAMQGATFGLIFCAVNVHSLWSVKIAEYLAAGIPLIVDKSMIGLPLRIIKEKRLGVVVDPDNPADYDQVEQVAREWSEWSERCIQYSQKRLDLNSTARQHLRLYKVLSRQPQKLVYYLTS